MPMRRARNPHPHVYIAVAAVLFAATPAGATELLVNMRALGEPATALAPLYTTVDSPANHTVTPPSGYDGVADLIISKSGPEGGTFRCTGALLNGGTQVLTAAHCVTDSSGAVTVTGSTATFNVSGGPLAIAGSTISVAPGWNGNFVQGDDIAIITLSAPATGVQTYGIYTDTDEIGQIGDKAGYGRTGTGVTGDTLASGTMHVGLNSYDTDSSFFTSILGAPGTGLVYDFDDGTSAHDAYGFFFGLSLADLGLGIDEVLSAPGDSGGPTFIDGLIAGVTSYGFNLSYNPNAPGGCPPQGCTSDINSDLDSSFGEFAVDTRVSDYQDWIYSIIGYPAATPVSAPATGIMFLAGLAGLAALRRNRRGTV